MKKPHEILNLKKPSIKDVVIKYYPNAKAINVGCKSGNYYNIYSGNDYLGQGKTERAAWCAAFNRHIKD